MRSFKSAIRPRCASETQTPSPSEKWFCSRPTSATTRSPSSSRAFTWTQFPKNSELSTAALRRSKTPGSSREMCVDSGRTPASPNQLTVPRNSATNGVAGRR